MILDSITWFIWYKRFYAICHSIHHIILFFSSYMLLCLLQFKFFFETLLLSYNCFMTSLEAFLWGKVIDCHERYFTTNQILQCFKSVTKSSRMPACYLLTHTKPKFHFSTPWKHQKTRSFLMFSGGIEKERWLDIG